MSDTQPSTNELLTSIDPKLGALVTLAVDFYIRNTDVAKPKKRSLDRMLTDVGLSPLEVSNILGKTDRAVRKLLQEEHARADKAKPKRAKKPREAAADGDVEV